MRSGLTCTSLSDQSTIDAQASVGKFAGQYFRCVLFQDSSAGQLCEPKPYLSLGDGSITGKTFHLEVWTLAAGDLSVQQGTDSAGVTGVDGWANTKVSGLTFSPAISYSSGVTYAICLTMEEVDVNNYASWDFADEQNTWPYGQGMGTYQSDGTNTDTQTLDDAAIEVFTMQ